MTKPFKDDRMNWIMAGIIFVAGLVASGFTGYFSNDKSTSNRLTVVETKVNADELNEAQRLDRLEGKLDKLSDKFDAFILYVTGSKPKVN